MSFRLENLKILGEMNFIKDQSLEKN